MIRWRLRAACRPSTSDRAPSWGATSCSGSSAPVGWPRSISPACGAARLDARVAIKRLLPAFAHERRFVEMFVAEARLAATLHHPNIAKVLDVGIGPTSVTSRWSTCPATTSACCSRGRLAGPPMPLPIAISIMYGVTSALAYVHDPRGPHANLKLVHRDISPSNILVSFDGAIKLVDFGIARIETGIVTRTASGQLKGKFPYMSPE